MKNSTCSLIVAAGVLAGCGGPAPDATEPGTTPGLTSATNAAAPSNDATNSANAVTGEWKTTASGLKYQVLKSGGGTQSPKATDQVRVHYHGTLLNGNVFDSSVERGEPARFPLNRVIPGWTEGVQLMKVGDKFKFEIPPNLAYGANSPAPTIPPNSTLVFEVELLSIE